MLPAILQDLEKVERTICGFQYQLDHQDIIAEMILRISRYGVQSRLILDKDNFYNSSCVRQSARVNELFRAGGLFRIRKPRGGKYACVHIKCLIFDEEVMLSGSMNLTHNGLQNNKEHLYRLSEPDFIGEALADFEKEWLLAEPVTQRERERERDTDYALQGSVAERCRARYILDANYTHEAGRRNPKLRGR
jgi:phosphatidylserine/phosphatidylglycerophosphate/cardiolipin synthase-like enzyme